MAEPAEEKVAIVTRRGLPARIEEANILQGDCYGQLLVETDMSAIQKQALAGLALGQRLRHDSRHVLARAVLVAPRLLDRVTSRSPGRCKVSSTLASAVCVTARVPPRGSASSCSPAPSPACCCSCPASRLRPGGFYQPRSLPAQRSSSGRDARADR